MTTLVVVGAGVGGGIVGALVVWLIARHGRDHDRD